MSGKHYDLSILYIEDEADVRNVLSRMLAKRVKNLHVAGNGMEGLELFRQHRPELVITDIRMPIMDGLEMARQIKVLDRNIPIILTTAYGDAEHLIDSIEIGINHYIMKPVDAAKLFSAIDKCSVHIKVRQQEDKLIKQADELKRLNSELTTLYERMKNLSLNDHLTGIPNRRSMEIELSRAVTMAIRYVKSFSVIMLDIDHFKKYNDTHGHAAGDHLLVIVANILIREIRSVDFVCRYGGEEFLILLPEIELPGAYEVAERIRRTIEADTPITISCGVSSFNASMHRKEALIHMADMAMYQAKSKGRNRVEMGA